jgi:polysaccharide biosynthesis protein PslG
MNRLSRIGALLAALLAAAACVPAVAGAQPLFGFNDNAVRGGRIPAAQDAGLAASVGANITRLTFDWRWVEPYKGSVSLWQYDQIYKALMAHGIRPLFMLAFAPQWARSPTVTCNQWKQECRYPPDPAHYADWRRIVATIATRYPGAAGIEVWNEANTALFWQPRPDATAYADLLKQTKAAVKAVNPSLPVITSGLGIYDTSTAWATSTWTFLNTIYARAGKASFDGIGMHAYPSSLYNGLGSGLEWLLWRYRATRNSNGDNSKPLWFTEGGYRTGGSGAWTEQQQAQGTSSLYSALAGAPDVRAVVLHELVDGTGGYGVVHSNLTPKPAFCSLATLRGKPC